VEFNRCLIEFCYLSLLMRLGARGVLRSPDSMAQFLNCCFEGAKDIVTCKSNVRPAPYEGRTVELPGGC